MSKEEIKTFIEKEKNSGNVFHFFCPYRVCPLGAHVDHQLGLVTGFAIDKGTKFSFFATEDCEIEVYSDNFEGMAIGNLNEEYERQYIWADYLFGAAYALKKSYTLTKGLKGIVSGEVLGGGLSSSASVILTYLKSLAFVNDINLTSVELVNLAIDAERNFIGVNVGKLDQRCEVFSKKNNLLYLDTKTDSAKLIKIPKNMPDFEIAIIFSGLERKLAGSAYNMRVDECKAASYALKGFAHLEYGKFNDTYLRDVPAGIFLQYKDKLPSNWAKRAEHFYSENERVKKGVKAFQNGNLEEFGKLIFESGRSSIEKYETGSEELKVLQNIMENTDGIYGGRFSGAGFNGCAMAVINPEKKNEIAKKIRTEYLKSFPELKSTFNIIFCKTADGIN